MVGGLRGLLALLVGGEGLGLDSIATESEETLGSDDVPVFSLAAKVPHSVRELQKNDAYLGKLKPWAL